MASKKDRGLMPSHGTTSKGILSSTYRDFTTAKRAQQDYLHNIQWAQAPHRTGKEKREGFADAWKIYQAERKQAAKNERSRKK